MTKSLLAIFAAVFMLIPSAGSAFDRGDILVRLRGIYVLPDDHSGQVNTVPGSGVRVNPAVMPELDFTYMLTRNFSAELILATTRHTIHGQGTLANTKIGSTWLLPPTLLLQYHFFPCCRFQPYAGVGVNYSIFYSEKSSLPATSLHLSDSWAVAFQLGMDVLVSRCWFLNFDVKWIDLDTRATLKGGVPGRVHVNINPWILGIGIGRRF